MKILLEKFDLNCDTMGFHPHTQRVKTTYEVLCLSGFKLSELSLEDNIPNQKFPLFTSSETVLHV